MSREIWRRLPTDRAGAGRQLARSESLLNQLQTPSFYWYQARQPAFIVGAGQSPEVLDRLECHRQGFEVYQRTSGGTVVLAGPDFLSLDVALPPASRLAATDVTLAYRWFAESWAAALGKLGLSTALVEPPAARQARLELETASPLQKLVKLVCFGTLSSYEVVGPDGRKLVGLAQIKRRPGSLLQAGVHLRWPGSDFACCLRLNTPDREPLHQLLEKRATGLAEALGYRPPIDDIIRVVEQTLLEMWPVEFAPGDWTVPERQEADRLEQEKFYNLVDL